MFHAQYLAFMERARTELLIAAGVDLSQVADRQRVMFLVHEIHVKYHQPARLNDLLAVSAEVAKMGRASVVFRQNVKCKEAMLVEAEISLALVNRETMKPARMPEELEKALT